MRKSTDSGVKWAEYSLIIGTGCRVHVLAWSSIAQSVCQRAFSLLVIWCLGSRVQILLSTEEHNLSPFDLNIACLCQSIEINNNKYVCVYACVCVLLRNHWFQWHETNVLDNWQLAELPQLGGREFDPRRVHDNLSVPLWVYMRFCARASTINQQICISPAPGRSSKLTHAGVEIDNRAFQTGCQLSSAASGMSLELCLLTQFQWHDANALDNWQLVDLPQSGAREFDPRRVHDNLSVTLWVYMRLPVPEYQN